MPSGTFYPTSTDFYYTRTINPADPSDTQQSGGSSSVVFGYGGTLLKAGQEQTWWRGTICNIDWSSISGSSKVVTAAAYSLHCDAVAIGCAGGGSFQPPAAGATVTMGDCHSAISAYNTVSVNRAITSAPFTPPSSGDGTAIAFSGAALIAGVQYLKDNRPNVVDSFMVYATSWDADDAHFINYKVSSAHTTYGFSVTWNTAPPAPGAWTNPAASAVMAGTFTAAHGTSTDPDGDSVTYENDFWNGSTWVAQAGGTSFSFNSTAYVDGTGYQFRTRAYDGTAYSSYTTVTFTIANATARPRTIIG